MADFQASLERTLRFEDSTLSGVITHDTGGATRFGISQVNVPSAFPAILTATRDEALKMAGDIYREKYWRFDGVKYQAIADKIFDMAVNMGLGTAVYLAQGCVGTMQDGEWGPRTEQAVNDAVGLLSALRQASAAHYRKIASLNPERYGKYLKGWLERAES